MLAWLNDIRAVRWWVIWVFFAAHLALNAFFNFSAPINAAFASVYEATGGLINGTLLPNLIMIALLIGGICLGLGGLRPRDLGLNWQRLGTGAALLLLTWGLLQAALVGLALASGEALRAHPRFEQVGVLAVIGSLLGQLLGNALFEEIGYRGFVFPQLYKQMAIAQTRWRMGLALFLSLALFALIHIPARLSQGVAIGDLFGSLSWTMVLGLVFAFFFLRTQWLWWAVVVHALGNTPTPLIAVGPGVDPSLLIVLISLALLILSRLWRPFRAFIDGAPSR